jgi:NadR type nicotinamide-nucleotide adenylyltransferase
MSARSPGSGGTPAAGFEVRPAALRIAIYGPESTGKSSLAAALAERFGEPWAPEYVRAFWNERGGRIVADDLDAIARGQIEAEAAAARRARRVMFADTELLTNVLWADLLFPGACPAWVRREAEARSRHYALYVFCDTDLPFEPDPQRCFPDEAGRSRCRHLWLDTLERHRLPALHLSGPWPTRLARAEAAVNRLLAGES